MTDHPAPYPIIFLGKISVRQASKTTSKLEEKKANKIARIATKINEYSLAKSTKENKNNVIDIAKRKKISHPLLLDVGPIGIL